MAFIIPGQGELDNIYCTDEWLYEQFGGDRLWAWGRNNTGALGDNTTADKSSPVQTLTGGTNWKQVSGGTNHSCAIKTDGTLWTWGDNFYGQLGDNISSGSAKSSPTQTIASGTNWKQVSAG